MPTQEERDRLAAAIAVRKGQFDSLTAADADYARRNMSGALSFANRAEALDRVVELMVRMRDLDTTLLPYRALERLMVIWVEVVDVLGAVAGFVIADDPNYNWRSSKTSIEERIDRLDKKIFDDLAPVAAFLGVNKSEDSASERIRVAYAEANQLREDLATLRNEAASLLDAARADTQKVGVSRHAAHFVEEASAHETQAKTWLRVTGAFATITTLLAVLNLTVYIPDHPITTAANSAQIVVGKVLLFSILLSAVVWAGKICRAHRHNFVVNKHRANALSSFETFVDSTKDEGTKNAVLLQATQSIFAPQPTGFVSQDADAAGPAQIVELTRTFAAGRS